MEIQDHHTFAREASRLGIQFSLYLFLTLASDLVF